MILQEMEKYASEELLSHCVFALSQLREGYGLEQLVTLIKSHPNAKVRKQAFFWLAHSDEDRAMPLLDELLSDA